MHRGDGGNVVYVYYRPFRWTVCNFARAATLAAQSAQLLSNALSASETVEEVVTLALMGACTVEGIVGLATFIREHSIYDKLDQSPEEGRGDFVT